MGRGMGPIVSQFPTTIEGRNQSCGDAPEHRPHDARMRLLLPLLVVALVACGARDGLGTTRDEPLDAAPTSPQDASVDASGPEGARDAGCWRCADRAWRNVCVEPAVRAPDSESCARCGEHCADAGPVGCWRCAALWAPDCSQPTTDAEMCVACGERCNSTADAGGE